MLRPSQKMALACAEITKQPEVSLHFINSVAKKHGLLPINVKKVLNWPHASRYYKTITK